MRLGIKSEESRVWCDVEIDIGYEWDGMLAHRYRVGQARKWEKSKVGPWVRGTEKGKTGKGYGGGVVAGIPFVGEPPDRTGIAETDGVTLARIILLSLDSSSARCLQDDIVSRCRGRIRR